MVAGHTQEAQWECNRITSLDGDESLVADHDSVASLLACAFEP